VSLVSKGIPSTEACAPMNKSGSTEFLLPLLVLYFKKALPARKSASFGIGIILKKSPEGQLDFLQKLVDRALPVSELSYDHAKQIMFIQEMSGGWKLYGKTGNGLLRDKDDNKTRIQHGWFVGYIEKGDRKVVFASHIVDNSPQHTFASFRARGQALTKLWYVIEGLEK